jgi:Xaa-Pro aminopeptidase
MNERKQFPLGEFQAAIREGGVDGWLFYDFRGLDPISRKVLGLNPEKTGSRRWFYMIPAHGEPSKLVHAIETSMLDPLPGKKTVFLSWESLQDGVGAMVKGMRRVAMQYSPRNEVPYVSRVDAGTVELVRSRGVDVVTSADLVQRFDATVTEAQLGSHRRAGAFLRSLVDEAFDRAAAEVAAGRAISEKDLRDFMVERIHGRGLIFDAPPNVSVGPRSADPHYEVPETGSLPLKRGEVLLIDVWAKEKAPGSIYADITWTAFLGDRVPDEVGTVFRTVRDARDAAIRSAREAFQGGKTIHGYDLDRAARGVIEAAGHGKLFIHRTGHSLHAEVHGNGTNLDDLETHDTRAMLPRTLFTIEPGIYFPGKFGIRSEVNVHHAGDDAEVTGPPIQGEMRALLS